MLILPLIEGKKFVPMRILNSIAELNEKSGETYLTIAGFSRNLLVSNCLSFVITILYKSAII